MELQDFSNIDSQLDFIAEDIEKISTKIEKTIHCHFCNQTLSSEQTEKVLSQIRALKEQYTGNIGIAAIFAALYAALASSVFLALFDVLSHFASSEGRIVTAVIEILVLVGMVIYFIYLILDFKKRNKDKFLVFKYAYMEQILINCIKQQSKQETQTNFREQSE